MPRGHKTKLTDYQITEIQRLRRLRTPIKEVAKIVGVKMWQVQYWSHRNGQGIASAATYTESRIDKYDIAYSPDLQRIAKRMLRAEITAARQDARDYPTRLYRPGLKALGFK